MIRCETGVTILGAGQADAATIEHALELAPFLLCADGGADTALRLSRMPDCIAGDMDSLSGSAARRVDSDRILEIREQESTDFDKCVRLAEAPFYIAAGVVFPRIDHALASLNVLVRHAGKKIALLTETDFCFLCPPEISLELPAATRLSLFPMAEASGRSWGLKWPIDGLRFSPSGAVGTSNETSCGRAVLKFPQPAVIVIVPAEFAAAALPAFLDAEAWPMSEA